MIGQKNNIKKLNMMKENNRIPHFILINGPIRSGKGTLINEFCNIIGSEIQRIYIPNKTEIVKDLINTKNTEKTIYIIEYFEELHRNAQNALLKILEDCNSNIYFIISTNNKERILETILSRAIIFNMEPYSLNEKQAFINKKDLYENCDSPAEMEYWNNHDFKAFNKFTNNFYDGLLNKSITSCLIELKTLNYKDDSEKGIFYLYFLKDLIKQIYKKFKWLNLDDYKKFSNLASETIYNSGFPGINKNRLIDVFLIKTMHLLRGK